MLRRRVKGNSIDTRVWNIDADTDSDNDGDVDRSVPEDNIEDREGYGKKIYVKGDLQNWFSKAHHFRSFTHRLPP